MSLDHAGADGSADPFATIDHDVELQQPIEQTGLDGCTPQQFIIGDDDLAVCVEMNDENWEETFLEELSSAGIPEDAGEEDDEED